MKTTKIKKNQTAFAVMCRRWLAGILVGIIISGFIIVIVDIVEFYDREKSTYCISWYDRNILIQPYTNLRIAFADSKIDTTQNAVGDTWIVKETIINDVEYWTILKTIEMNR